MRYGITFFLLYVSIFCLTNPSLFGQGCCTGGIPLLSNLGLSSSPHYTLDVLLSQDINVLKDVVAGTEQQAINNRSRFTYTTLLEANYGLTQRLSASALLTYVVQRRQVSLLNGGFEDIATRGLGDMAFLIKYSLLKPDKASRLAIGVGPKLPTGASDLTNRGIRLPADLQPGSGAWDAILWGYFSQSLLIKGRGRLTWINTFRFTGTNDRYGFGGQADRGYKFGNEWLSTLSLGEQVNLAAQVLDIILSLQYRLVAADKFGESIQPGTGGQWLNFVPGLGWSVSPRLAFRFSATLPIYRNLADIQLTTSYKVTGGMYLNLDFAKPESIPID